MPISFFTFVVACKAELIKRLRENDKVITDRLVNDFYTHIMGQFYTHPTEKQREVIIDYAKKLIKNGEV